MPRPVLIVVTPRSGNGSAAAAASRVARALVARGRGAAFKVFEDSGAVRRWARHCPPRFSHLVCVGGDTTMSAAAGAAVRLGVPLVAVPTGFGNLFAGALGLPAGAAAAVALIDEGQLQRVDVGLAEEIFLCNWTYGLLERIEQAVEGQRDRPRPRPLRYAAYVVAAARCLLGPPVPPVAVEVDGRLVAGAARLVTVANVRTYGSILPLTPAASPRDGLLDVCAVDGRDRLGLLAQLVRLALRMPVRRREVATGRGRDVIVRSGSRRQRLTVIPRALPVLVPAAPPRAWPATPGPAAGDGRAPGPPAGAPGPGRPETVRPPSGEPGGGEPRWSAPAR